MSFARRLRRNVERRKFGGVTKKFGPLRMVICGRCRQPILKTESGRFCACRIHSKVGLVTEPKPREGSD